MCEPFTMMTAGASILSTARGVASALATPPPSPALPAPLAEPKSTKKWTSSRAVGRDAGSWARHLSMRAATSGGASPGRSARRHRPWGCSLVDSSHRMTPKE